MAHRQASQHSLRSRWKRLNAKVFNAAMPEPLHALLRKHAQEVAQEEGGQTNINKVLVLALYERFGSELTEEERANCEAFLQVL